MADETETTPDTAAEKTAAPAEKPAPAEKAAAKPKPAAKKPRAKKVEAAPVVAEGPPWEPFSDLGMTDMDRNLTRIGEFFLLGVGALIVVCAVLAAIG